MKINEVEALVGITKKNIRFYEAEGLLAPHRNSENGYRDYGEAEVDALRRIKLLRKLGVPLEEIRRMQSGGHTVGDGMRRHLVTLERERENLEQSIRLCSALTDRQERLEDLDAGAILAEMEAMEQSGTTFQNRQHEDVRVRYVAPVAVTVLMVLLMLGLMWLFLWAFETDPAGAPPLTGARLLSIQMFCQFMWVISGIVGALSGRALPEGLVGFEFALTALFTVLAIDAFRVNRDWSLPASAVACVGVGWLVNPGQMLVIGLVLYFAVLLARVWSPRLDAALTWRSGTVPLDDAHLPATDPRTEAP